MYELKPESFVAEPKEKENEKEMAHEENIH
jgi:hypothetical protein